MNTPNPPLEPSILRKNPHKKDIFEALETAFDSLVQARKLSALSKDPSYEKIGQCIDCLEEAFIAIHKKRKRK